ncbi:carboxypeptidase-like regulatory domain-containing protein [Agitococcus lubricus]|uniref:Carboxypeptidase family protein n=1 Tax=Agitococcus lubricus TaxID=1077255 RepID=A0A2T5IYY0_9GAMM|nr:carboxypeptidase-like regulatory domain-containing protein [Agitococcus lubricus]PTQ89219.1 carboxypeptidase family protein [Agitococcus lubricus]
MLAKLSLVCCLSLVTVLAQADVLKGEVTNQLTQAKIIGATVNILDMQLQTIATAQTDSQGVYQITVKKAGVYNVDVHAQGYQSFRQMEVTITPKKGRVFNAALWPNDDTHDNHTETMP